jgi:hypothetical protein
MKCYGPPTSPYPHGDASGRPHAGAVPRADRAAVGADRVRRLRGAAGARGAVQGAVRHAQGVAQRRAVRTGPGRGQPAPRPGLHAACDLLRLRGPAGALLGGLSFILPGLLAMLALAAAFLSHSPPSWLRGAGVGAGAAVAAVAVRAGVGVAAPIVRRAARRAAAGRLAPALAPTVAYALSGGVGGPRGPVARRDPARLRDGRAWPTAVAR